MLVPAMLVAAAGAALVAAATGPAPLAAGTVALGLAAGACAPSCVRLIADHVPPADRGVAMGLFEAACGLSFIAAGLVGGHAADALGAEAPYVLASLLAVAWSAVLLARLRAPAGRLP